MKLFKDFKLNPNIQEALDKLGFSEPTEIQSKSLPVLLGQNVDFHGQAQTGTGKTLAFGIPLIQRIDVSNNTVQGLIVAPTRELVLQICESIKKITSNSGIRISTVYGGTSIVKQFDELRRGAHIVVGTPGRLNDHLRRKTLNLKDLQVLILDEADIMLDMGFKEEIDEILKFASKERSIWLFSATVKEGISDIKNKHMKNVITVRVSQNNVGTQNTQQFYCVASSANRLNVLSRIIDSDPEFYGFIFCPTKALTGEIAQKLSENGYNINCLHGDMDQTARTRVIKQFREKKFSILIATDVAARGIDVPDITHVVNYCLPNDQDSYVHRIGRTGRAGKKGIAITFINNSELRKIRSLSTKFSVAIEPMKIPTNADVLKVQMTRISDYVQNLSAKDVDSYKKEVSSIFENYTQEQLNNILSNLLIEKFFKRFDDLKEESNDNYNDSGSGRRGSDRRGSDQRDSGDRRGFAVSRDGVELEVGLGSNDSVTTDDIKKFFIAQGQVDENQLSKIKVLRRKSFVVVPNIKVDAVMTALRNQRLNGLRARVSFAKP